MTIGLLPHERHEQGEEMTSYTEFGPITFVIEAPSDEPKPVKLSLLRLIIYPICLVIGHRPIPMIDCEGVEFGKACMRCGVRV